MSLKFASSSSSDSPPPTTTTNLSPHLRTPLDTENTLFTVLIGPSKTAFHFDRTLLLDRIPYFSHLFSFEDSATSTGITNSVHLDTEVDTEDAFTMVKEFILTGRYYPPNHLSESYHTVIHAEVYLIADRLLMEDLKEVAYRMLAKRLTTVITRTMNLWVYETKTWEEKTVTGVDVADVVQVVRLIYGNTGGSWVPEGGKKMEKMENGCGSSDGGRNKVSSGESIRKLMAKYCTAHLNRLKLLRPFIRLVKECGEFAADLMVESSAGTAFSEAVVTAIPVPWN